VDLVGDLVVERCGVEHGSILANKGAGAQAQLRAARTGTIFHNCDCYGHSVRQVILYWAASAP
jgi:ethanolamine utilization protein EutA (predicted chaperonin)